MRRQRKTDHIDTGGSNSPPYVEIDEAVASGEVTVPNALTKSFVFAVISCVLCSSFQFGWNSGVVNSPEDVLHDFINGSYHHHYHSYLTDVSFLWSTTVSIFCIGGLIGGLLAGTLADYFGRKGSLLVNNLPALVGGLMMFLSGFDTIRSFELLIAGRFVIGLQAGFSTGLAPIYLSEISSVELRGATGTINQLTITIGILLSNILGLRMILGSNSGWKYLFGFTVLPAFISFITLPFCAESPRYLMINKNEEQRAEISLMKLRNTVDVGAELTEIKSEGDTLRRQEKMTLLQFLRTASLRRPLLISVVLQLSQQLSGINAVIYYSTSILVKVFDNEQTAQYATLGVLGVNVAMTFVSAFLMDRAGRRLLHLIGLAGMFCCACLITASFLLTPALNEIFDRIENREQHRDTGSIPWLIVPELFSQNARPIAMSVSVATNWLANFIVGISFPHLQTLLGDYTFIPFAVLLALFWLFTFVFVPETKNKTFEEITELFADSKPPSSYGSFSTGAGAGYERLGDSTG